MSKPNNTPSAASVTPSVAELQKLTPAQAAADFVKQTISAVRAFIVAAKLLIVLEPTLKPGQTLGSVILKLANVPADNGKSGSLRRRVKSTIDNGRQAVRVWKELVEIGHITEAQFDEFTFGDFLALNRVMSGASRQKLTGADVALILQSSPQNWHEELECLFHYGQTLADRAVVEEKQAAKKAAKDETKAGETGAQEDEPVGTSPDAPTASDKPEPGKIVKMPIKATADDAFKLIAALESLINSMEASEVEKVAPAIAELNTTVQSALKPVVVKKAAVKRKVAHRKTVKSAKKAA